jgi:hypothetical protein
VQINISHEIQAFINIHTPARKASTILYLYTNASSLLSIATDFVIWSWLRWIFIIFFFAFRVLADGLFLVMNAKLPFRVLFLSADVSIKTLLSSGQAIGCLQFSTRRSSRKISF